MMRHVQSGLGVAGLALAALVVAPPAQAAEPECGGKPATIVVPSDASTAEGTDGDDVIYVRAQSVTVHGLGGDDTICQGSPYSGATIYGDDGDDLLIGSWTMEGGAGDDVLRVRAGGGTWVSGGEGNDRIRTFGKTHFGILPGGGDDTIIAGPDDRIVTEAAGIVVDATARTIVGEGRDTWRGNPTIQGTEARDVFRGSAGPDRFSGFGGGDRILGRGGNDVLSAVHPAVLSGGPGNDRLGVSFGGTATGGSGDDVITTGLAAETVEPGTTVEPFDLSGGPGADTFVVSSWTDEGRSGPATEPAQRWRGSVAGGRGFDRLRLDDIDSGVLRADLVRGIATFHNGRATLHSLQGLVGGAGPDVLRGDAGANTLVGRGGDDLLVGGPGRDMANGGAGRDTCRAVERRTSCERR